MFNISTFLMNPGLKLLIKHPELMKSRLFLKLMATFPARISNKYDQIIEKNGLDYKTPFIEGLSQVNNEPKKILDICTGTGFAAFLAAEQFPESSIEAIDQSSEMIKLSRIKAEKEAIGNINFQIGNAMRLDYPDETFDLIVTSNAPIYLSEAARVLKPGGELLVTFFFGGEAFENSKTEIMNLIHKYGLGLQKMARSKKGVFVLTRKSDN